MSVVQVGNGYIFMYKTVGSNHISVNFTTDFVFTGGSMLKGSISQLLDGL